MHFYIFSQFFYIISQIFPDQKCHRFLILVFDNLIFSIHFEILMYFFLIYFNLIFIRSFLILDI